uniref:Uncharacterized protein n=1 Tax=Rhodnius prolixus TaxID=13249 RepID=T1H8W5_RHOPR
MALEEGISYCSTSLTARIFFGTVMTSMTSAFLISLLINHCVGCVLKKDVLFLVRNDEDPAEFLHYQFFEVPIFILFGIIGGLTGSAWNCLEVQISYWRKKYVKKNSIRKN